MVYRTVTNQRRFSPKGHRDKQVCRNSLLGAPDPFLRKERYCVEFRNLWGKPRSFSGHRSVERTRDVAPWSEGEVPDLRQRAGSSRSDVHDRCWLPP